MTDKDPTLKTLTATVNGGTYWRIHKQSYVR